MNIKKHIITLIICSLLVVFLNFLAFQLSLYWRFWWFDLFMHFSGGVLVSYASILLYKFFLKKEFSSQKQVFILALSSAFLVGALWELLEFGAGFYVESSVVIKSLATLQLGFQDTLSDLLADLFGACLTALLFIKRYYKKDEQES